MTEEEVKQILEENLRLTKETNEMVRKIKRHIAWQKAISIFYLVLFVAPLLFSIIYLPSLLKGVFSQYSQLQEAASVNGKMLVPSANPIGSDGSVKMDEILKMLNEIKK